MLAFFFWNETMTDYLKVNLANWNDRAAIHVKDEAGGYRVKEFLNGADNLHGIEDREIGDVRGKRIAHLQCHFGIDTLCLARRGATCVGLDFSPVAIAAARDLQPISIVLLDVDYFKRYNDGRTLRTSVVAP